MKWFCYFVLCIGLVQGSSIPMYQYVQYHPYKHDSNHVEKHVSHHLDNDMNMLKMTQLIRVLEERIESLEKMPGLVRALQASTKSLGNVPNLVECLERISNLERMLRDMLKVRDSIDSLQLKVRNLESKFASLQQTVQNLQSNSSDFSGRSASVSQNTLLQNDWPTLEQYTTIRLFSKRYSEGGDSDSIWNMGDDIQCVVNDDKVQVTLPSDYFDSSKPIKLYTHGYGGNAKYRGTKFVEQWMTAYNKDVNVILVDWEELARVEQFKGTDNYSYDSAARNSIDTGEYLGYCFAALSELYPSVELDYHLVGHSLGAHVVGKAGRVFKRESNKAMQRITGLDPAGPRFVDGPILNAIPELNENRFNDDVASFVDVIHTCGGLQPAAFWIVSRLGDLHQIGHADFYPNGGEEQIGCGQFDSEGLCGCSHGRSVTYYLESITNRELFPSKECGDIKTCKAAPQDVPDDEVTSYMGEYSQEYISAGERKLYYLNIPDYLET